MKVPRKSSRVSRTMPAIAAKRAMAHRSGWRLSLRLVSIALARQVEIAGLAVDRKSDHRRYERHGDQGRPNSAPNRFTDAGGAAGGGESVVGMDQHHRYGHNDGL